MSTHQVSHKSETGVVKFFKNGTGKGSGYGFISREGGLPDVFVHASQLRGASYSDKQLFAGDQVSFEIGEGKDGKPCAFNVRVQLRATESPTLPRTHE